MAIRFCRNTCAAIHFYPFFQFEVQIFHSQLQNISVIFQKITKKDNYNSFLNCLYFVFPFCFSSFVSTLFLVSTLTIVYLFSVRSKCKLLVFFFNSDTFRIYCHESHNCSQCRVFIQELNNQFLLFDFLVICHVNSIDYILIVRLYFMIVKVVNLIRYHLSINLPKKLQKIR